MADFREIDPKEITTNVFDDIGSRWMLITAGNREKCNTMTASWGGLGVYVNKHVSFIFVRDHRYTYEFTEREDYYTLCFFPDSYKSALTLCGTKSGRDMDKIKEAGLTTLFDSTGAPYFAEAELVLVCKKIYSDFIAQEGFFDRQLVELNYPERDFHKMYIGEIVKVLTK